MAMSTSDVLDRDEGAAVCSEAMLLFGLNRCVEGRIRTVRCAGDNALVRAVLGQASAGEVLVVDGSGGLGTALLGDMIAASAMRNGWAGVIVLGAVRDTDTLAAMPFHVKALGRTPRKSAKTGAGEEGVAVVWGGVAFQPGEYVYSDADGIVVVGRHWDEAEQPSRSSVWRSAELDHERCGGLRG